MSFAIFSGCTNNLTKYWHGEYSACRALRIAQSLSSYLRIIDRDSAGLPVRYALQMSGRRPGFLCLVGSSIVRFLIKGSGAPAGNGGELLRFTVVACCGGAAQPCLSYPPPPRLLRFLDLPPPAPLPVPAGSPIPGAPANRPAGAISRPAPASVMASSFRRPLRAVFVPPRRVDSVQPDPCACHHEARVPSPFGASGVAAARPCFRGGDGSGAGAAHVSRGGNFHLDKSGLRFPVSAGPADFAGVGE